MPGLCPKTYIGRSLGTQRRPSHGTDLLRESVKTFDDTRGAVPSKSRGVHSPVGSIPTSGTKSLNNSRATDSGSDRV